MRKQERESSPSKGRNSRKTAYYAGSGLAIGAGIGVTFGLMLFENLTWGCVIGTAVGLVVEAAIECKGATRRILASNRARQQRKGKEVLE